MNADQLGELQTLATENIPADQIADVAGMIQEQGAGLAEGAGQAVSDAAGGVDLGAIAEQVGLPVDIVGQISGLLGR
ncbi:chemotaxis protein [Bifidobacterium sp. SMB2]|uniref:Chemotaxis protein n=1 Tax=Bifidobacterium saimiriisciurei TaxID=2661627 RepID=A0ABX0CE05_9BIFI|nr:chemotaxis protein [Bifidobacterium sp. SMB2]NEH10562.1 chemotaxis protein [Bifidobacterium saimiriisciurei]NEH10655.1 chemotaxis protein [Bifidobacterium saimiriisciurei]